MEDVFLDSYLAHLDREKLSIEVLSLAQGSLFEINNGKTKRLFKIGSSYPRLLRYCLRYVVAILYIILYWKREYDTIHFLNIKRDNFYLIPFFRKRGKKIILTVYGRSTYLYPTKRYLFSFVYRFVDIIVFSNPGILKEFSERNPKIPSEKFKIHIPPLNTISLKADIGKKESIEAFLSDYNIDDNLIKISCSSTVHSYDQHDNVIEALKKLNGKEKVLLMFLLTYGGTKDELNRIIKKIRSDLADFKVCIFTKFLSERELAAYRALTDIYINMRSSDQMSGAILESIVEGAMLISASWLNYETLDNIGVHYKKVNGFNELAGTINEGIEKLSSFKELFSEKNAKIIRENFSYEVVMKKWEAIYSITKV